MTTPKTNRTVEGGYDNEAYVKTLELDPAPEAALRNVLNEGGAAFPVDSSGLKTSFIGMTLLDYFAGQAVTGVISSELAQNFVPPNVIAERAYAIAREMVKIHLAN